MRRFVQPASYHLLPCSQLVLYCPAGVLAVHAGLVPFHLAMAPQASGTTATATASAATAGSTPSASSAQLHQQQGALPAVAQVQQLLAQQKLIDLVTMRNVIPASDQGSQEGSQHGSQEQQGPRHLGTAVGAGTADGLAHEAEAPVSQQPSDSISAGGQQCSPTEQPLASSTEQQRSQEAPTCTPSCC
jgi:pyruvate/2-oxoglutarate dehydrogenase complex dihydrolipoamide acyltransferase (E2) component